jgi:phosphatidylinositol 3-kinase
MWLGKGVGGAKNEDEAAREWEGLVEESLGDWKAGVIDWAHEFVQTYWRK